MSRIHLGRTLGLVSVGFVGGHVVALPLCGFAFMRDTLHGHVDMAVDAIEWIPNTLRRLNNPLQESEVMRQRMKELKDRAREYQSVSKQVEALIQKDEKRLAEASHSSADIEVYETHEEFAKAERDETGTGERSVSSPRRQIAKAEKQQHAMPFDIPELHDKKRQDTIENGLRWYDAWQRAYYDSERRLNQLQKQSKDGKWPDNLEKLKSRPWPAKDFQNLSEDEMQLEIE